MDIKIRCPHCDTKLIVDDDLIGQPVLCEDCDKQFTVEKPAAAGSSGERPRVRDRDDDDEKPRSRRRDDDEDRPRSRDDYDDEDDRPRRRRPKGGSSNIAPIVFGTLLLVMTSAVGVGLFFAFGFNAPRNSAGGDPLPVGGGGAAGGQRFRITAAEWQGNGFTVTVETTNGQPDLNQLRLVFKSDDGRSGTHSFSMAFSPRSTFYVNRGGFGRSRTTLSIDLGGGAPLSNTYTLN